MQFNAKARYVSCSPYKLRPIVDVIRGKDVAYALQWLETYKSKRMIPVKKVLVSAVCNAWQHDATLAQKGKVTLTKMLQNLEKSNFSIKDFRVDQGPIRKYFKPGAMGRAVIQRKRFSHLSVILEPKA